MRYAPAVLAVLVAACATPQQRLDNALNRAASDCARMGYATNSPEYRQCVQGLYAMAVHGEQARREQAARDFAGMAAILAQPQPVVQPAPTVLCRQSYAGVYCQ